MRAASKIVILVYDVLPRVRTSHSLTHFTQGYASLLLIGLIVTFFVQFARGDSKDEDDEKLIFILFQFLFASL